MARIDFPVGGTVLQLSASASQASTVTGTGVDLNDYEGAIMFIQNHGTGTGTLDGKIQDSADNSSWADVSGATFTQSTTTADLKQITVDRRALRRYVRYVGTIVTGPQNVAAVAVGMKKTV